jgi:hypothetical protein
LDRKFKATGENSYLVWGVNRWVGAVGWRIGWHVVDIGEDLFPYSALLFTLVRLISPHAAFSPLWFKLSTRLQFAIVLCEEVIEQL